VSAFDQPSADCRFCMVYSASDKWRPMTAQIRFCHSTKFALDLNTGSRNLAEVNKINTLIGHCTCTAWKISACSVGTQQHCAIGLAEVGTHFSGTDSHSNSQKNSVKIANNVTWKISLRICHSCFASVLTWWIKSQVALTRRVLIGLITSIARRNPKAIK